MTLEAMLKEANRAPLMADEQRHEVLRYMNIFFGGLVTAFLLLGPIARVISKMAGA